MLDVNVTYEEMESVSQQLTSGYEDISGKRHPAPAGP